MVPLFFTFTLEEIHKFQLSFLRVCIALACNKATVIVITLFKKIIIYGPTAGVFNSTPVPPDFLEPFQRDIQGKN